MNWDEEVAPGWRRWEQHLAEWHARRSGDAIPADSSGAMWAERVGRDWFSEAHMRVESERTERRWAEVQASPTGGATYLPQPNPDKITRLSDAMSVRYDSRMTRDTRPTEATVLDLVDQERIRRAEGDIRYLDFEFVPATPSARDLGIVE